MTTHPTAARGLLPHLIVPGGAQAIAFYERAFGARLHYQLVGTDGRLGHAEMSIGEARFMLADEFPEMDCLGPQRVGGTPVSLSLYVDDVDAVTTAAVEAGAELTRPIADEFYGDRVAHVRDPFGHRWTLHTRLEDLSPEEIGRRFEAMSKGE